MSHGTCLGHVVTCRDVSLARECLAVVAFMFRFAFHVHVHILGSRSRFVIQLDVA